MKKSSVRLSFVSVILIIVALCWLSQPTMSLSSSANINVTFEIEKVLSLTLSSHDLLIENLVPGTSDNTNEINVNVLTNSESGYVLSASMGDIVHPYNSIQNLADSTVAFSSIGLASSVDVIPAGSFGYSIDHGATYSGLPNFYDSTAPTEVINETLVPSDDNIPFLVGATAHEDQARGIYVNTITFTAIANKSPSTIDKIIYMQDVDEDTFNSMKYNTQYQLTDKRDGKKYFVTKMISDDIWMTQNLDFEITKEGVELQPETSDVLEPKVLKAVDLGTTDGDYYYYHNIYYYDGGDYYCPNGYCSNGRESLLSTNDLDPTDTQNHYSLGSYYSFYAAMAQYAEQCPNSNKDGYGYGQCMTRLQALSSSYVNVPTSICPSRWQLPSSPALEEGTSVYSLTTGLGLPRNTSSYQLGSKLWASPAYFNTSGYSYYSASGSGDIPSSYSYYWTSTIPSYTSNYAYYYYNYIYQGSSDPTSNYGYFYNNTNTASTTQLYSIRCVARKPSHSISFYLNDMVNLEPYLTKQMPAAWTTTVDVEPVSSPYRQGYVFLGWGTEPKSTTIFAEPGKTIHANNVDMKLYAIWKKDTGGGETPSGTSISFEQALASAGKSKTDGYYSMQDIDSTICETVSTGETAVVRDSRDGKLYNITKYKLSEDGAFGTCWMSDDLRFGSTTESYMLTPDDSDVSENFEMPAISSWTSNSTYKMYNNGDAQNSQGINYGYIYNYNLATAGSFGRIALDTSLSTYNMYVTDSSICPKNWTLPRAYAYISDPVGRMNSEVALWDGLDSYSQGNTSYYTSNSGQSGAKARAILSNFANVYSGYISSTSGGINGRDSRTYRVTKDFQKNSNSLNDSASIYEVTYTTSEMFHDYWYTYYGYTVRCMIPVDYYFANATIYYYYNNTYTTKRVSKKSTDTEPFKAVADYTPPKKPGYRFLGWADTSDATEPVYQNGDTIYFEADATSRSVYAVWEELEEETVTFDEAFEAAGKEKHNGYYTMQDMTREICDAVSYRQESRLIDLRDNKVYWVTRFASVYDDTHDGICWMTQNLDFRLSYDGTTLYPSTSDVEDVRTIVPVETGSTSSQAPGLMYQDGGDLYRPNGGVGQSYNSKYSEMYLSTAELSADDENWHYHVGSFYGFGAATVDMAGYNYPTNNGALESVCPKGWKLPYALSSSADYNAVIPRAGSYQELLDNVNAINAAPYNKFYPAPFYAMATGYLYPYYGSFSSQIDSNNVYSISQAYYWTANPSSGYSSSFTTYFGWSNADTSQDDPYYHYTSYMSNSSYYKYYAMPVRCVAR